MSDRTIFPLAPQLNRLARCFMAHTRAVLFLELLPCVLFSNKPPLLFSSFDGMAFPPGHACKVPPIRAPVIML